MTDKTAFSEEGKYGPPEDSGPVGPTDEEMGRPAYEQEQQEALAQKNFNRRKMGGFLMELGLNILASNRDDAGAAVGDAANKTRADRTERKRVQAATDLATSERERKRRREDESDTLKEEKAARERRREKRDISSADRSKLKLLQKEDGTYEYVDIQKGEVLGADGKYLRGVTKADKSKTLNVGQEEIKRRAAQGRLDDRMNAIRDNPTTEEEDALGYDPTYAKIVKHALSQLSEADRQLFDRNPPDDIKDFDELQY